jgi:broad specificity phosphatase PhoE
MLPHKPFYFIRHGETDWNKQGRPMGTTDIQLNDYGIEQAWSAAHSLMGEEISSIVASPLQRALKMAEIIAEKIQKPITVIDNLKECCWGIYEGNPKAHDTYIQQWLNGAVFDGAETVQDFNLRVISAIKAALEELPGPVLFVSHGGVYCAIQRILALPDTQVKNCIPIFHRPPEQKSTSWFVCEL